MIYTSSTNVLKTRDYRLFCIMMDIPFGAGTARYQTPAENRTVKQFLLAVNSGRRAVFFNLNSGLAVFVEPRCFEPERLVGNYSRVQIRRMVIRIDLHESSFEGADEKLKGLFWKWYPEFEQSSRRYSWQTPLGAQA